MMHSAFLKSLAPGAALTAGTARCGLVALLLLSGAVLPVRGAEDAASKNLEPVRFAFSFRMFADVNENDAKASVKAWALALARERGVPMSIEPIVLSGDAALMKALRDASIDGAAVTTEEYLSLDAELQGTNLFMSFIGGHYTEEYLLLVRADSAIANLRGLRGRKITVFDNPRASLAPLWLDVILSEQGLGAPAEHFGQLLKAQKLAKVVLPVFFRQQDACIVTRRGFETMCELNPQVRAQLRVLATSPQLVPALGFIRRSYDSPLRDALLGALKGLEKSPAGTQVLTLFQSDQLHEAPATLLGTARELVEAHRRLKPANAGAAGQPSPGAAAL
jgi:phosphonate transport system substrate-binding protein